MSSQNQTDGRIDIGQALADGSSNRADIPIVCRVVRAKPERITDDADSAFAVVRQDRSRPVHIARDTVPPIVKSGVVADATKPRQISDLNVQQTPNLVASCRIAR